MSLIECKECGKEISDKADSCPHCGAVIPKSYETTVKRVGCFGACNGKKSLNKKLTKFAEEGWEVVSSTPANQPPVLGGLLNFYIVTLRKKK